MNLSLSLTGNMSVTGPRSPALAVLDSDGNSYSTSRTVLDSDGNSFTVSKAVLDSDGNSFTVN